jgi:hypothetical protein
LRDKEKLAFLPAMAFLTIGRLVELSGIMA